MKVTSLQTHLRFCLVLKLLHSRFLENLTSVLEAKVRDSNSSSIFSRYTYVTNLKILHSLSLRVIAFTNLGVFIERLQHHFTFTPQINHHSAPLLKRQVSGINGNNDTVFHVCLLVCSPSLLLSDALVHSPTPRWVMSERAFPGTSALLGCVHLEQE